MLKKINKIIILSLALVGCGEERYWNGGYINEYPDPIPELPPQCDPVEDPLDWEPAACAENNYVEHCYWYEHTMANRTPMAICRHDWEWDKWECEWSLIISHCESVEGEV